jgi:Kinesin motor domain
MHVHTWQLISVVPSALSKMGSAFVMQEGSNLVRKAKLNLVDLAGSERVSRTNSDGMLLKEAKYINLSLHYLEQVIIALQVCSGVALRRYARA